MQPFGTLLVVASTFVACSAGPASNALETSEARQRVESPASRGEKVGAPSPQGEAPTPPPEPAARTEGPCKKAAVAEPYRWYPRLDLARIPFHASSGPFGEQVRVMAPEPPRVKRKVTVHSAKQLIDAALQPGTEIRIGRSIADPVVLFGDVVDVDIVVPKGTRVGSLTFGSYEPPSVTRRVRVRGPTPMTHSGGLVGMLTFYSIDTTDVIIDGVDLNGDDGKVGDGFWGFRGGERIAIVNNRGHSVGYGALQGGATHVVIAGNNLLTGARSRKRVGYPEGWGVRGGDLAIFFDNYIEGSRYHKIRVHPHRDRRQYTWIADNVFVDRYEARIVSTFDLSQPAQPYEGLWAQCNTIYAHTRCMTPSFDAQAARYARLTYNTLYGSFTRKLQKDMQRSHGAGDDLDYLTGNSFHGWRPPPKPGPPGDPREIPLPDDGQGPAEAVLDPACPGP